MRLIIPIALLALPLLAETRVAGPFPVDANSEAAVAVLNGCKVSTAYQITIFDSQTGAQVATQQGSLLPLRSAVLTHVPNAHRDALVAVVETSCNRQRSTVTVRDRVTKVASFAGGSDDGQSI